MVDDRLWVIPQHSDYFVYAVFTPKDKGTEITLLGYPFDAYSPPNDIEDTEQNTDELEFREFEKLSDVCYMEEAFDLGGSITSSYQKLAKIHAVEVDSVNEPLDAAGNACGGLESSLQDKDFTDKFGNSYAWYKDFQLVIERQC